MAIQCYRIPEYSSKFGFQGPFHTEIFASRLLETTEHDRDKLKTSCNSLEFSSESCLESSCKFNSDNSSEKGCSSQGAMFNAVSECRTPCGVNSLSITQ